MKGKGRRKKEEKLKLSDVLTKRKRMEKKMWRNERKMAFQSVRTRREGETSERYERKMAFQSARRRREERSYRELKGKGREEDEGREVVKR